MGQRFTLPFGINGFTLKWIAMITMMIDHMGLMLFPQYPIFRIIGRLAFPIYCFLLVEGAVHTSDIKKYLLRLLTFALVSEIPFNLVCAGEVWNLGYQNVFFTLALGLAAIAVFESVRLKSYGIVAAIIAILAAEVIHADYGGAGVVFILIFYLFRERIWQKILFFLVADIWLYGGIQNYAIFSLIPIICYNGKRGPGMKYMFYFMYPIHLLLLYGLKRWIG